MLSIYGSDIAKGSVRQNLAPTTTQICPKFIQLISQAEDENCESCKYKKNKAECLKHDCVSSIQVCEDFSCRKNLFWENLKVERHNTTLSRIMRNCGYGLIFIDYQITLEEIASMYGLTRERIRQIEERGVVRLAEILRHNRTYWELLPPGSMNTLDTLIKTYRRKCRERKRIDLNSKRRRAGVGYHN